MKIGTGADIGAGKVRAAEVNSGRVGGWLTLSACAMLFVAGIVAATGGAVSAGGEGVGGTAVTAAFVLLAVGAGVLAATAPPGLDRRSTRIGLGLVAAGLAATLATSNVSASSMLVFVFLAGGAVSLLGLVITVLGLARSRGKSRYIAVTFVAGLGFAIAAGLAANAAVSLDAMPSAPLQFVAGLLAAIGAAVMVGAIAGIGVLGARTPVRRDMPAGDAPS